MQRSASTILACHSKGGSLRRREAAASIRWSKPRIHFTVEVESGLKAVYRRRPDKEARAILTSSRKAIGKGTSRTAVMNYTLNGRPPCETSKSFILKT